MTKSSKLFRLVLVPFGLLLVVLFSWSTMVSAAPQTVQWSGASNRSNTGDKSVYPSVAYDAQGFTHIIWLEYGSGESSRLMYTNNINGSFISPFQVVDNAGKNVEHITALAVETNRVHVFFTSNGKSMRHMFLTLDGSSPTRRDTTTLSQGRGYAPTATVDNRGRVHAAWIDNRNGTYQVYHRIWENGSWSGTNTVRDNGRSQDSPSITATNDGRVHITFSIDGETLGYSYYDGNWRNGSSPASEYGNISGLTTDGNTLYAVWSNKGHRVFYAEGSNGNWNNRTQISEGATWSDFPTIAYSAGNNKLYAAWSAPDSPGSKIVVREISPGGQLNDLVTVGNTAPSTWGRAAASRTEVSILWQDKSPGAEEIRHVTAVTGTTATPSPTPSPTPPPPSGSLELFDPSVQTGQDGALYTNQASVNAVIRQTGGSQPDQFGLSDGGDPGDPGQSFSGPEQTVQYSLNTSDNSCRPHQVNGRLQSSQWGISELFGDSITYDPSVEADIQVRNPNLLNDVPTPTPGTEQARAAASPTNFGDPRYTNMSLFYLSLRNAAAECSGLRSYSIDYTSVPSGVTDPTPETKELTSGGPGSSSLPGTAEGEYRFRITLNDNAGNTRTYPLQGTPFSMTYDNTAPVVRSSETITPTEIADGYVRLDLSAVTVTDNLYRTNDDREYYGAWILVRRTGTPSDTEWQTKGVPVVGDITNLKWNMAMGMVDQFEPGQYRMYIRFIDGASNASERTVITAPVQIDTLEGPRQALPQVHTP